MNSSLKTHHLQFQQADIYRLVSTDKQEKSLELQERRTLDYAQMKGLVVEDACIFSDPDTSGSIPIRERDGGRLLINHLQESGIKHLIVSKLNRIGRDLRDGIEFLDFCKNNSIAVHIVDLGGESISTQSYMGQMFLNILLNVEEWERESMRERTRKQMNSLFDQHKLTGNIPYGWDCVYEFPDGTKFVKSQSIPATELVVLQSIHGGRPTKLLVDNHAEQGVILYISRAVKNKCKRHHIALDLNKRGLKSKLGRDWQIGHVTSVLNNRYTRRLLKQPTLYETALPIPPLK